MFFLIFGAFMKHYDAESDIPGFVPPATKAAGADLAVVVFAEQTRLPKLRLLKPGFRHCYAYLRLPQGWIGVDPLSHWLVLQAFPNWPREADLAAHLRRAGLCALTVPVVEPARRPAPPLPFSCVETVKRLIGLQSWAIRTPWELFLHLRKICLDRELIMFYISILTEQKMNKSTVWIRPSSRDGIRAVQRQPERKHVMGGLFGSPPPAPPPAPPPPVMEPEPQVSEADQAAEAARERRRRAQGDTIATSWRGLGGSTGTAGAPKRLIGD